MAVTAKTDLKVDEVGNIRWHGGDFIMAKRQSSQRLIMNCNVSMG